MLNYAPPEESINKNSIADYELRTCCGNNIPTYPYVIGQVATEYLVASGGFQKIIDVYTDFKMTKNFEKSFENVYGFTEKSFYEKFDAMRSKLSLPEISWKLHCDQNYKLSEYPKNPKPCPMPTKSNSDNKNQPPKSNPPSNKTTNQQPQSEFTPPPVDFTKNIEGLGCKFGAANFTNTYGTYVCKELADGNNLWQKID
jgi:hypothetical protein